MTNSNALPIRLDHTLAHRLRQRLQVVGKVPFMSIAELSKSNPGQKIRHHNFAPKISAEILFESFGHFWLRTTEGKFLTVDPTEAASGWALAIAKSEKKMLGWAFLRAEDMTASIEFFEDGLDPWDTSPDGDRNQLKNWHRLETFDFSTDVYR